MTVYERRDAWPAHRRRHRGAVGLSRTRRRPSNRTDPNQTRPGGPAGGTAEREGRLSTANTARTARGGRSFRTGGGWRELPGCDGIQGLWLVGKVTDLARVI